MNLFAKLALVTGLFTFATHAQAACTVANYHDTGKSGPFKLSLNYPKPGVALDRFISTKDFRTDWQEYLKDALAYAWKGQLAADFVVQNNKDRAWFHAPWLHVGHSGRERLRGLTRERNSRPSELQDGAGKYFANWGIGFFNEAAASQLGKIWTDFCNPSMSALQAVIFPEGSFTFKVLMTEANEAQIKALEGAPIWEADVHEEGRFVTLSTTTTNPKACRPQDECPRKKRTLTLLQIDVAIKDKNATETGWVYGTFVYDSRLKDKPNLKPWERLTPISISWGNDPTVKWGGHLKETRINDDFSGTFFGWSQRVHLGWGGRANGPVDNPASSCTACHGTAQYPGANLPRPLAMEGKFSDEEWLETIFKNIKSGETLEAKVEVGDPFKKATVRAISLDYSLQTQLGLENMCLTWVANAGPFENKGNKPDICPKGAASNKTLKSLSTGAGPRALKALILQNQHRRTSKGNDDPR